MSALSAAIFVSKALFLKCCCTLSTYGNRARRRSGNSRLRDIETYFFIALVANWACASKHQTAILRPLWAYRSPIWETYRTPNKRIEFFTKYRHLTTVFLAVGPCRYVEHNRTTFRGELMSRTHQISIDGNRFVARRGELLLDAALNNGVDLPYNCRSGHCGTCCVRVVSGELRGGAGSEPGIVHACQCRIVSDAVVEKCEPSSVRTVDGVLTSLRPLSADVMEVGITTDSALPHHAGQYAQVRFSGYPSRPFSITHPLRGNPTRSAIWFHVRRMAEGRVTSSLGKHIKLGHPVSLTGPYGSAHFRSNAGSRLILVATNTGFAPIWSIAVAALRENPQRRMMIIAGGRSIESLYMGAALAQLARFPNVLVLPICSTPQSLTNAVLLGRPTDYLPRLLPTDVVYVCGAPGMVEAIKAIAAGIGAACYADPFMQTTDDPVEGDGVLTRAIQWLAVPALRTTRQLALDRPRKQIEPSLKVQRIAEARLEG